jgi:hypothetical protein
MANGMAMLAQLKTRRVRAGDTTEPAHQLALPPAPPPPRLPPLENEPAMTGMIAADTGGCEPAAVENILRDGPKSRARIVICNGVDCGGLGAGATLLEIEELVSEHSTPTSTATVVFGGCTLQCTNAPVVNVLRSGCPHELDTSAEHHACVNTSMKAKAVVATALRSEPDAAEESVGIMQRRADGMRFDALRKVARMAKPHGELAWRSGVLGSHIGSREHEESHRLLRAALQAEANAARGSPKRAARAERRAARLKRACSLET